MTKTLTGYDVVILFKVYFSSYSFAMFVVNTENIWTQSQLANKTN